MTTNKINFVQPTNKEQNMAGESLHKTSSHENSIFFHTKTWSTNKFIQTPRKATKKKEVSLLFKQITLTPTTTLKATKKI